MRADIMGADVLAIADRATLTIPSWLAPTCAWIAIVAVLVAGMTGSRRSRPVLGKQRMLIHRITFVLAAVLICAHVTLVLTKHITFIFNH